MFAVGALFRFLLKTKPTATRTMIIIVPIIKTNGTSRYWVCHFHVMLDGCSKMNSTVFAVPNAGMLPVPFQPEQICWVITESGTGVSTKAFTEVSASSQPVVGVGEP